MFFGLGDDVEVVEFSASEFRQDAQDAAALVHEIDALGIDAGDDDGLGPAVAQEFGDVPADGLAGVLLLGNCFPGEGR